MKRFLVLACLALFGVCALLAQTNDVVVSAIIKDKDSRKELGNVNIVLVGSNIGTVSKVELHFFVFYIVKSLNYHKKILHFKFCRSIISFGLKKE